MPGAFLREAPQSRAFTGMSSAFAKNTCPTNAAQASTVLHTLGEFSSHHPYGPGILRYQSVNRKQRNTLDSSLCY